MNGGWKDGYGIGDERSCQGEMGEKRMEKEKESVGKVNFYECESC